MNSLWYYSHRFSDSSPEVRARNLADAKRAFAQLIPCPWAPERILWAPWIALAESRATEGQAWVVIEAAIAASDGILFDLDGGDWSEGMRRERYIAERLGKLVEVMM